jgi:hypothetical protein
MRVQRVGLEHHGNSAVLRCEAIAQLSADAQFTFRNFLKPRDHAQQSGFSAAGGADKNHQLAMCDFQIDAFDDVDWPEAFP